MQRRSPATILPLLLLAASCTTDEPNEPALGSVHLAMGSGDTYDVTQFRFRIHPNGAACDDAGALVDTTVALATGTLPEWMAEYEGHAFASQLFVLPAADYLVCSDPLQADASPSVPCARAQDTVTVVPEATAEVVLLSACNGEGNGGIDVVAVLGDPATIDGIDVQPGKFVTTCDTATITPTATDSLGDPITSFDWSIVSEPVGAMSTLTATGSPASFSSDTPGSYDIRVQANDPAGGFASLVLSMFVSDDPCP